MKNILIPTDFSENAMLATDFTINLFGGSPTLVNLYHFYGLHHSSGGMLISIDDLLQKDANRSMSKEVERLQSKIDGTQVELFSKNMNGVLTDYISEIISNNNIDLIAMGTLGSTGVRQAIFGSNTSQILNSVHSPVLVVPYGTEIKPISGLKVSFATDFKSFAGAEDLKKFIATMEASYGALEKEVVYVSSKDTEPDDKAKQFCAALLGDDIKSYATVNESSISAGLMSYCEEHKPDILVMVHRKNSFIDRLLRTSISTKMALNSKTPLLILKD